MNTHRLKCWPIQFGSIKAGYKTWELRYDDRSYAVGDCLLLEEWLPDDDHCLHGEGRYTGRKIRMVVSHIALPSITVPIPKDHVIMSIDYE